MKIKQLLLQGKGWVTLHKLLYTGLFFRPPTFANGFAPS